MKLTSLALRFLALAAAGLTLASVHAAEKKVAGPNGGRVLTKSEPRAEFFVRPDRTVQITFLDRSGKPIPAAEQTVTVTAGDRSAPKTLTFAKSGPTLVSNVALPAGESVPTVVQIKPTPTASTITERFNVDVSVCGECKLAEYACICAH